MTCSAMQNQTASSTSDTLDTFDTLDVASPRAGTSSSLEDYLVEGKIGSGKFSTVFIARHIKTGKVQQQPRPTLSCTCSAAHKTHTHILSLLGESCVCLCVCVCFLLIF